MSQTERLCCCICAEPVHSRASYGEVCVKCGKHRPPNGKVRWEPEQAASASAQPSAGAMRAAEKVVEIAFEDGIATVDHCGCWGDAAPPHTRAYLAAEATRLASLIDRESGLGEAKRTIEYLITAIQTVMEEWQGGRNLAVLDCAIIDAETDALEARRVLSRLEGQEVER